MSKKNKTAEPDYSNLVVKKSNDYIVGKYKASLLEQKIVAIALTRLHQGEDTRVTATIFPQELKQMLGVESDKTHIYRDLKKVSKEMTGHVIEIEDHGDFHVFSLITNADYINGVFTVTFNNQMTNYIYNLKTHFTSYSLANTLQLNSPYSFRMYELIKMDAFKLSDKCPYVMHDYGLSELKFMLGVLNINDENARKVQRETGDWDAMAEACSEQRFKSWSNFRRLVLDKAQDELNEKADVTFNYNQRRAGKGGKVTGVCIIIHRNTNLQDSVKDDIEKKENIVKAKNLEYEQLDFDDIIPLPPAVVAYKGHNNLTEKDLRTFYKEAHSDGRVVINAINKADEASKSTVINNYVGWIIGCIRRGYDEPQPVADGTSERGDQVKGARQTLDSLTETDMSDLSAKYWNKAKEKNTEVYQKFISFIESQGITLAMFEAVNTPGECGTKFMDWIKGETIEII